MILLKSSHWLFKVEALHRKVIYISKSHIVVQRLLYVASLYSAIHKAKLHCSLLAFYMSEYVIEISIDDYYIMYSMCL